MVRFSRFSLGKNEYRKVCKGKERRPMQLFGIMLFALSLVWVGGFAADNQSEYGGTLAFPLGYGGTIETLDPIIGSDSTVVTIADALGDGLLRYDLETLEIEPAIAESWEIGPNYKVYTFHLRHGVQFGKGYGEVTASDFEYTFERVLSFENPSRFPHLLLSLEGAKDFYNGKVDHIEGIKILGKYTLQLTTENPDVIFMTTIASNRLCVVPKAAVEKWGPAFGSHLVSAGPFELVEWVRGSKVEVKAFDKYYGGRPYLDNIEFLVMPESASRDAAFRAGAVDISMLSTAVYTNYKEDPQYKDLIIEVPELWTRVLTLNLREEKWQDVRVRQAANYAIDRETLNKYFLMDKAYVATSFLPKSSPGFDPNLKPYEYNLIKARELMEAAGYSKDHPFEFTIMACSDPAWGIAGGIALKPYLEAAYFKLKTVLVDSSTMWASAAAGDFDTYLNSAGLAKVSPVDFLSEVFASTELSGRENSAGYSSSEFDEYIKAARQEPDFEKRMVLVRKADALILSDAAMVFWNYSKAAAVHQAWVHGFVASPQDMIYQPWDKIWLDPEHSGA